MDVLELPRPVINFLRTMSKEMNRYSLCWDIFGGTESVTLTLTWKIRLEGMENEECMEQHQRKISSLMNYVMKPSGNQQSQQSQPATGGPPASTASTSKNLNDDKYTPALGSRNRFKQLQHAKLNATLVKTAPTHPYTDANYYSAQMDAEGRDYSPDEDEYDTDYLLPAHQALSNAGHFNQTKRPYSSNLNTGKSSPRKMPTMRNLSAESFQRKAFGGLSGAPQPPLRANVSFREDSTNKSDHKSRRLPVSSRTYEDSYYEYCNDRASNRESSTDCQQCNNNTSNYKKAQNVKGNTVVKFADELSSKGRNNLVRVSRGKSLEDSYRDVSLNNENCTSRSGNSQCHSKCNCGKCKQQQQQIYNKYAVYCNEKDCCDPNNNKKQATLSNQGQSHGWHASQPHRNDQCYMTNKMEAFTQTKKPMSHHVQAGSPLKKQSGLLSMFDKKDQQQQHRHNNYQQQPVKLFNKSIPGDKMLRTCLAQPESSTTSSSLLVQDSDSAANDSEPYQISLSSVDRDANSDYTSSNTSTQSSNSSTDSASTTTLNSKTTTVATANNINSLQQADPWIRRSVYESLNTAAQHHAPPPQPVALPISTTKVNFICESALSAAPLYDSAQPSHHAESAIDCTSSTFIQNNNYAASHPKVTFDPKLEYI